MVGRKPGARLDGPVEDAIKEMAVVRKWRPAQIRRELEKRFKPNQVPHIKTVQKIWRQWNTDESDVWRFADEDTQPEDAALILPVLDALQHTASDPDDAPGVWTVTKEEAKWIVKIGRTYVMPANWRYALARAYIAAVAGGRDTQPLDRLMADRRWDVQAIEAAQFAVEVGQTDEAWESIEYAAELLPFLPGPWQPDYDDRNQEA